MTTIQSNPDKTQKAVNRPVHTIRYALVRAAVWRNVLDNGKATRPVYCVTFTRSYKDAEDRWKECGSFGFDDLLLLAKAADEAHTWVAQQRIKDSGHGDLCG
jgi:hypothetical protein